MKDNKSKRLAYLLRHDTSYGFDVTGWRYVRDLTQNHGFTLTELVEIVKNDEKGRYEMTQDLKQIRALQGHSIPGVEPGLLIATPPDILYHGTSTRFIDLIHKEGLKKMSRNHVHLSRDLETAEKVGFRHGGDLVILEVDCKAMVQDGYKFWISKNNVWLSQDIPPKYFKEIPSKSL